MDSHLKKVEGAIQKASKKGYGKSLDSLRREMNKIGYNFSNTNQGKQSAYIEAIDQYWSIREFFSPLKSFKTGSYNWKLSATELEFEDKKYFIYGLVHGNESQFPSEIVNGFLRDETKRHHKPKKGSYVFYEDDFDTAGSFEIKKGESFGDFSVRSNMDKIFYDNGCIEKNKYVDLWKKNIQRNVLDECLSNLSSLCKAKEVLRRTEMFVEPLRMEYDSVFYRTLGNVVGGRSKFMAQKMFECDKKEVHAFVGMSHEDQIAYFIKEMHAN